MIVTIPIVCHDCKHCTPDETPDGENMWSYCEHPDVTDGYPYYGRISLDDGKGRNVPPEDCPLRKRGIVK